MKKLLLIAFLPLLFMSCGESGTTDSNVQTVNIEDLTPGPIAHETLTEDQLNKIGFIQRCFGRSQVVWFMKL